VAPVSDFNDRNLFSIPYTFFCKLLKHMEKVLTAIYTLDIYKMKKYTTLSERQFLNPIEKSHSDAKIDIPRI